MLTRGSACCLSVCQTCPFSCVILNCDEARFMTSHPCCLGTPVQRCKVFEVVAVYFIQLCCCQVTAVLPAGCILGPGGVLLHAASGRPVPHSCGISRHGELLSCTGETLPDSMSVGPNRYAAVHVVNNQHHKVILVIDTLGNFLLNIPADTTIIHSKCIILLNSVLLHLFLYFCVNSFYCSYNIVQCVWR